MFLRFRIFATGLLALRLKNAQKTFKNEAIEKEKRCIVSLIQKRSYTFPFFAVNNPSRVHGELLFFWAVTCLLGLCFTPTGHAQDCKSWKIPKRPGGLFGINKTEGAENEAGGTVLRKHRVQKEKLEEKDATKRWKILR